MTNRSNILPTTYSQERVWFLDQLQPGSPVNNETILLQFQGEPVRERLCSALEQLVRQYEILRTRVIFDNGTLGQFILPPFPVSIQEVHLSPGKEGITTDPLLRLIAQEQERSFFPSEGVLFHCSLITDKKQEHYLCIVAHRIILDSLSLEHLATSLLQIYQTSQSEQADLYQIAIEHQNLPAKQESQNSQLRWWQDYLAQIPNLELPSDFPRPNQPSHRAASAKVYLEGQPVILLRQIAQVEGVDLSVLIQSLFRILLARYTDQADFALGIEIPDPIRREYPDLLGPFSEVLAIRRNTSLSNTVRQMARAEQDELNLVKEKAQVRFHSILEALRQERDVSRHPVFQAYFRVLEGSRSATSWQNLGVKRVLPPRQYSLFDIGIDLLLDGDTLTGWLNANADIFQLTTIQHLAEQFECLLKGAAISPDSQASELPLLNEQERQKILVQWNATDHDFPKQKLLHQLFEEQCERTPNHIALEFEGEKLTYAQFNARANQLAHALRHQGIEANSFIGVLMERSIELVLSLYAILKAGCAYISIDPELPRERLDSMLEDSAPKAILLQGKFSHLIPGSIARMIVDQSQDIFAQKSTENLPPSTTPEGIAYVIFTSGSTGRPKGVMNHHKGIVNRIWWMQDAYRLDSSDAVLQKTPFSFDVSVWEFFWPLMAGARLVLSKPGGHRDPDYLTRTIQDYQITTIHFVPSMLEIWMESGGTPSCTSLRRVICSGEALGMEHQRKFFELSGAELHNLYGPTEAAVDVTSWQCSPQAEGHTVPIGRPIYNIRLYILDSRMQPVPIGAPGELFIGGVGVARGYMNRPSLTAERFLPDPFQTGGVLYRTGDICRWREDGVIDYLGRADFQVKIRGFRIELGEIEQVILQHPAIRQAAVIAQSQGIHKQLIAYLVPQQQHSIHRAEIRDFLSGKLPEYMIPSSLVVLDQLPLSPNGKLDRKALPDPDAAPDTQRQTVAPRTEIERELVEIWQDLLGIPNIGIHDNFFEYGGHSLLVMQMLFRIRSEFDEQLSVHSIFNAPTVAQLARTLSKKIEKNISPSIRIPAMGPTEDAVLTPLVRAEGLPPLRDYQAKKILLTGASGFLGAFLAHELLQQSQKQIYCLVRADSPHSAMERIRKNLERRGLWWPTMESRLIAIPGDLTKPRMGMTEEVYHQLTSEIDTILHNGALVDFVRPYHAIKPANVDGTVEVLRFATTQRRKPVHFVSTLSVYPSQRNGEERIEPEDSPLDFPPESLNGGYGQSKWVGEQLCFQARERDLLVNIYRPGVILGPSGTGNAVDFFHMLVKGCIQLGLAPDIKMHFNLTPVDYVAPVITELLLNGIPRNRSYNLVNPHKLSWQELLNWLSKQGYHLRTCSFSEWLNVLQEAIEHGQENALAPLLYFLTETPESALNFPWFDSSESRAALLKTSLTCPPAEEALLSSWLEDLQKSGFLPASS